MNKKLNYKLHIAQVIKKEIKAKLTIKQLRNLRFEVTCHLFILTVASIVDYASFIWILSLSIFVFRKLNKVQQIQTQAIIGVFYKVTCYVT